MTPPESVEEIPWGPSPGDRLPLARARRHAHRWVPIHPANPTELGLAWDGTVDVCICGLTRADYEARQRRGRNNRKRGNKIQRERIVALGGRNLAGNNPNLDGIGELFAYESKSRRSFPETLWRWVKGIPHTSSQTQVLIITEAGGKPGVRARSLVVINYEDWRALHGE